MRARRRDREHVGGTTPPEPQGGDGGHRSGQGQRGGRRRPRPRNRTGRTSGGGQGQGQRPGGKGPSPASAQQGVGFWGDTEKLPAVTQDVRITDDPAAVARSLGAPPLPGHERIAAHYFTVVYERAVQTAGALAAAGGLIDPETLANELSD
jgi:hypothetical protein